MKELPERFSGDHPIVSKLNRMLDCLSERTPLGTQKCPIDTLPTGFKVKPPSIPEIAGGLVEQFLFIRQYKDYIVGKRWTANLTSDARGIVGTAETDEVRIAKPFEIRTSHWHGSFGGYTYTFHEPDGSTRTARLDDASEFGAATISSEQEIFPRYVADKSLILATTMQQGSPLKVTETVNGTPQEFTIDYVELPGRVFINKERKIRVCIEGSSGPWFALFRPSGAFREE